MLTSRWSTVNPERQHYHKCKTGMYTFGNATLHKLLDGIMEDPSTFVNYCTCKSQLFLSSIAIAMRFLVLEMQLESELLQMQEFIYTVKYCKCNEIISIVNAI
jgi:hypothetical protein